MRATKNKAAGASAGFTLIELMIVVAVIAVIAAIAIPSYNSSVLKSKRAMGKGELLEVLSRQEQHFVNNKAYATTTTALGYAANPYYIDDQGNETTAAEAIYEIGFEAGGSASTFTIQATPKNGQVADSECGTLKITHNGVKTPAACW